MNNERRKVLKGLVYGSVLSATSFSTLALAASDVRAVEEKDGFSIIRKKVAGKEQVTLVNNTDVKVSLNSDHPVSLEYSNGFLAVKANQGGTGVILMDPKESLTFEIDAYNADQVFTSLPTVASNDDKQLFGLLNITSEHHAFNRTVPVTSLNGLAA